MIVGGMRYGFFVLILVVGSTLLVFGHIYVYRRLVRDVKLRPVFRRVGIGLIVALASLIPLGFILPRLVSRVHLGPLVFLTFFWLGLLFYLVLFLGLSDLVRLVGRVRQIRQPQVNLERRAFLARVVASSALVGSGAVTGLGVGAAFGGFDTPEVPVRLDRLPRALSGVRIALLSDLHLGPVLGRRFLEAAVEKSNSLKPDLVAITGDVVDLPVDLLGGELQALRNLRSRWGTFFSTGNHEFIYGAGPWMDFFRSLDIKVLANQRYFIGDPGPAGAGFDLAGIHDHRAAVFDSEHRPDIEAALAGRDPGRELVLLAHQPVQVYSAAEAGVGLQLSGHTHGGQIFPFTLLTWLSQPYISGLHRHSRHTQIYVTRGTGFWGPPMRVLAAPEISCIVLVA
jgi:predicted MPP superfamily phosphohydrolase